MRYLISLIWHHQQPTSATPVSQLRQPDCQAMATTQHVWHRCCMLAASQLIHKSFLHVSIYSFLLWAGQTRDAAP